MHGHPIYCASWSTDLYLEEAERYGRTSNRKGGGNGGAGAEAPPPARPPPVLRCFATCGGQHVTLFEAEATGIAGVSGGPSSRGSAAPAGGGGGGLTLRQAYRDPDDGEQFYTCAFGGRGLGGPFGYGRKADLVEDGRGRSIVLHAESGPGWGDEEEDDDGGKGDDASTKKDEGRTNTSMKRRRSHGYGDGGCPPPDKELKLERQRRGFRALADLSQNDGPQLLAAAGKRGIIKVIDTVRRALLLTLSGHGDEIYDIKFSPTDEWLLVSASKDESLRLWNVRTATCVAIFAGHEGHRDAALSVGWHPLGKKIASAGMDTTIKLWDLDGGEVREAIERSWEVKVRRKTLLGGPELGSGRDGSLTTADMGKDRNRPFKTVYEQMPYFSTNKVHTDYVDCVQFVGDLVLSKSISDTIVLWKPDLSARQHGGKQHNASHHRSRLHSDILVLREFVLNKCDVWFVRFATDPNCRMLAVGNNAGEVKVWDVSSPNPTRKHFANLTHPGCSGTVRMVSFSPDGRSLVATCDDSTIWKWDAV